MSASTQASQKVMSDLYHQALSTFCRRLPQNLPAKRTVQSLFAKMASDHDISAQEAIHLLLCEKLVGCSQSFVNLNSNIDTRNILTDTADLDNDDIVFKENFFQRYKARLTEFSHLNAVEYCSLFDVNKSERSPSHAPPALTNFAPLHHSCSSN